MLQLCLVFPIPRKMDIGYIYIYIYIYKSKIALK